MAYHQPFESNIKTNQDILRFVPEKFVYNLNTKSQPRWTTYFPSGDLQEKNIKTTLLPWKLTNASENQWLED